MKRKIEKKIGIKKRVIKIKNVINGEDKEKIIV